MFILILFSLVVHSLIGNTLISYISPLIQSGQTSLKQIAATPSSSLSVTFGIAFPGPPIFIAGIADVYRNGGSYGVSFQLTTTSSTTGGGINFIIIHYYGAPTNFLVRLLWMSFLSQFSPSTIWITQKTQNSDHTSQQYCGGSTPLVTGTSIAVFIQGALGLASDTKTTLISVSASIVNLTCFSVSDYANFGGLSNNYKKFLVVMVVPTFYFSVTKADLQIPGPMTNSAVMPFTPSSSTHLFIALSKIQYNLHFAITLSPTNNQIQINYPATLSQVKSCIYNYLIFQNLKPTASHQSGIGQLYLKNVFSKLWSNYVQFLYQNVEKSADVKLTDFTINTSSLSDKSVLPDQIRLTLKAKFDSSYSQDITITYKSKDKIIQAISSTRILSIKSITTSVFTKQVDFEFINIKYPPMPTITDFICNSTFLTPKSISSSANINLIYQYSVGIFGTVFSIALQQKLIQMELIRVLQIQTTVLKSNFSVILEKATLSDNFDKTKFTVIGPISSTPQITVAGPQVTFNMKYTKSQINDQLSISYLYSSKATHTSKLKLITFKQISHTITGVNKKLEFINIQNPSSVILSQFTFENSGVIPVSYSVVGDNIILEVSVSTSGQSTPTQGYFNLIQSNTKVTIKDLVFVIPKYQSIEFQNTIKFILQGINNASSALQSMFTINSTKFSISQIEKSGSTVTIIANFIGQVFGEQLCIIYKPNSDLLFQDSIYLTLGIEESLRYYQKLYPIMFITYALTNQVMFVIPNIEAPSNREFSEFESDNTDLTLSRIQISGSNINLYAQFTVGLFGNIFKLLFTNRFDGNQGTSKNFCVVKVKYIKTKTMINNFQIYIEQVENSSSVVSSQFKFKNSVMQNSTISPSSTFVKIQSQYIMSSLDQSLAIQYQQNGTVIPNILDIKIITVIQITHIFDLKIKKITFVNIQNPTVVSLSQFQSSIATGITLKRFQVDGNLLHLIVQNQDSAFGIPFDITFISNNAYTNLTTQELRLVDVKQYQGVQFEQKVNFYFDNINQSVNIDKSMFRIDNKKFQILGIVLNGSTCKLETSFRSHVNGENITIFYDQDASNIYLDIFPINLDPDDLSLISYTFFQLRIYYQIAAKIVSSVYLALFLLSLPGSKLLGIQSIFIAQLSFYSYLSIQIQYPPLRSVKQMGIVSGWNGLFQSLSQTAISKKYEVLGFKSNFLSSVNLMVFLLIICPIMWGVLSFASKINKSYKTKPRLLKQSKIFFFEYFFTILMFNAFKILISTIVSIQAFGIEQKLSLLFSILLSLIVLTVTILYIFYKQRFLQFKALLDFTQNIGCINRQTSAYIKSVYPACISFEIILISLCLGIQPFYQFGIYMALGVTVLMTGYCFFATPYIHKADNIRLLCYRCSINSIMVFHCIIKAKQETEELIYYISPFVIFGILMIVAGMQFSFLILRNIQWIRRKGMIDPKILGEIQQKDRDLTKVNKQAVDRVPNPNDSDNNPSKSYPKLEHSINRTQYRERLQAAHRGVLDLRIQNPLFDKTQVMDVINNRIAQEAQQNEDCQSPTLLKSGEEGEYTNRMENQLYI